ncbi:MAG TPA: hypothetical protein VJ766_06135, partial [Pseudoxanthomonas sp.]|nr:hypothetical protein [Pseudoxanthomonas sp.]
SIAPTAQQTPGQQSLSFLVKILLDEQDELNVRSGMSARADIYTATSAESLSVPVQAVRFDESDAGEDDGDGEDAEEKAFVLLLQDGKAVRRDVKTGIASDSEQEILEGLVEGDLVISGPFRVLRHLEDGDPVELKTEDDEDPAEEDQDDEDEEDD